MLSNAAYTALQALCILSLLDLVLQQLIDKIKKSDGTRAIEVGNRRGSLHVTGAGRVWVQATLEAELEAALAHRLALQVAINLQHQC